MVMEPMSAFMPGNSAKIAVVVAGHVLEDIGHPLGRHVGEERSDEVLVNQIGKVYHDVSQTH